MSLDDADRAAFDALTAELRREDPRLTVRAARSARLDAFGTAASHPLVIAIAGLALLPIALALGSVALGLVAIGCVVVGRQRLLGPSAHPHDERFRQAGLLPSVGEVTRPDHTGTPVARRTLVLPPRLLRVLLLPLLGAVVVVAW